LFVSGLAVDSEARNRRSWVPKEAWKAALGRAQADLGTQSVKVYKSFWSKRTSRGLISSGGKDAYVVHAKSMGDRPAWPFGGKTKGTYLVEKSSQGIYEAFPIAPNRRQKHVTTINARKDSTTKVISDGGFPPSKIVHGVKVKNAASVSARLGKIVASKKGWLGARTVFVLGTQDKGGAINASAQLETVPMPNVFYRNAAARVNFESGRTIMPPWPNKKTYHNVKYERPFLIQQGQ
jgi:hypothetical protein